MSLNGAEEGSGVRGSFRGYCDAWGRPTGGTLRPQTGVVFPLIGRVRSLAFFSLGIVRPTDRRPTGGAARCTHAVRLGWKLWNSLRLARCISKAASVSDWTMAR